MKSLTNLICRVYPQCTFEPHTMSGNWKTRIAWFISWETWWVNYICHWEIVVWAGAKISDFQFGGGKNVSRKKNC